jgi:hypothetical protein
LDKKRLKPSGGDTQEPTDEIENILSSATTPEKGNDVMIPSVSLISEVCYVCGVLLPVFVQYSPCLL